MFKMFTGATFLLHITKISNGPRTDPTSYPCRVRGWNRSCGTPLALSDIICQPNLFVFDLASSEISIYTYNSPETIVENLIL